MDSKKRIIEVTFPIEELSGSGARQITGLHTWWARRPLGPTRATTYAALVDNPSVSPQKKDNDALLTNNVIPHPSKHSFISELSRWENALNPLWIDQARRDILDSNNGKPPKVLDPFGGGGSIPLETLRLGCETHSCDLNPVSVLIQKCTLEYPQRYGMRLYNDVKKWGEHILMQVKQELQPFYPIEPDGSEVYANLWAHTLPCQNLDCPIVIPLMKNFWLAKTKSNKRIALLPSKLDKQIHFQIVGIGFEPIPSNFDPSKEGTIKNAVVTCPVCRNTIPAEDTRRLFQDGEVGEHMLAVVTKHPNISGKAYRLASNADFEVFKSSQRHLLKKRNILMDDWGYNPIPDEPTLEKIGSGAERSISMHQYDLRDWGSLYNHRQQLTLISFTEKIREAYPIILSKVDNDPEYARVITTYLGLWLNCVADNSSNFCTWESSSESVSHVFGRQALSIAWDYAESNPLRVASNRLNTLLKPLEHLSRMRTSPANVKQSSATSLPYPDNTFNAVLTDPPYYDNVPYAYRADFFYVWLKRSIGELYPDLLQEQLTPKNDEIVAYGHLDGGLAVGKQLFEDGLSKAFREIHRVLKPEGIAVIVYAHKLTSGWETLINALLDSGLVITAAWPIDTEVKSRLRARNTASLASSIYMVARKSEQKEFGLHKEVRGKIEEYLKKRYVELWESGISGADLFIASIGSALQVFGQYKEVRDFKGKLIRADRMLEDIRELVSSQAAEQIGTEATSLTRFYFLWRQEHGEKRVAFDAANQLALSFGIELTEKFGEESFIQRDLTFVRVLGPHERNSDFSTSSELIDILHHALLLWISDKREEMIWHLSKDGIGLNELIWNVAQAVSLALPLKAKERRWLEGWLADREAIKREIAVNIEENKQSSLF